MDYHVFVLTLGLYFMISNAAAAQQNKNVISSPLLSKSVERSAYGISSNSVVVALLDSQYTELAELVEKAMLLQALEEIVGSSNITILAPVDACLDENMYLKFKTFIHQPGNLKSLQRLLRSHVIPRRITAEEWGNSSYQAISNDTLLFSVNSEKKRTVDLAVVTHPNVVVKSDGVIHEIDRFLVPKTVQDEFDAWRSGVALAVKPQGAPVLVDQGRKVSMPKSSDSHERPPMTPGYYAMASVADNGFDGENQVRNFISTLMHYGGYNEVADIFVNLTSLASEVAKLVAEGYRMTVLAPNDEAMAKLSMAQLSQPGAPEQILYYHIIPEYQTEESFYTAVKRFGRVTYDTLRLPHKVAAREADGTVMFGEGEAPAHLFDNDIYIDGSISVQGIDKVLFPLEGAAPHLKKGRKLKAEAAKDRDESKPSKGIGWLLGSVSHVLCKFGKSSLVSYCY